MSSPSLPAPHVVLFDLDGTLADSEPLIARTQHEVLNDLGHAITLAELESLAGTPLPEKLQRLQIPPPHEPIDEEYRRRYRGRLKETPPIEGAEQLLRALAACGIRAAIISNKVEDGARRLVDALGWTRRFAAVVGRDTTSDGTRKPHPGPVLHALRGLAEPPERAYFVGDSTDDMVCGSSAGCGAVLGVTRTRSAAELRAAGATHICATLEEVAALLLGRPPA